MRITTAARNRTHSALVLVPLSASLLRCTPLLSSMDSRHLHPCLVTQVARQAPTNATQLPPTSLPAVPRSLRMKSANQRNIPTRPRPSTRMTRTPTMPMKSVSPRARNSKYPMSVADGGKQEEQTERRVLPRRIISSYFSLLSCRAEEESIDDISNQKTYSPLNVCSLMRFPPRRHSPVYLIL